MRYWKENATYYINTKILYYCLKDLDQRAHKPRATNKNYKAWKVHKPRVADRKHRVQKAHKPKAPDRRYRIQKTQKPRALNRNT